MIRQGTNSSSGTLPPGYVRKRQARLVGYNTPEDTIQSFLWAVQNHDAVRQILKVEPADAAPILDMDAAHNHAVASLLIWYKSTSARSAT